MSKIIFNKVTIIALLTLLLLVPLSLIEGVIQERSQFRNIRRPDFDEFTLIPVSAPGAGWCAEKWFRSR